MLSARNQSGDVIAWEVEKVDGPFICSSCKENVIIKKGRIKTHHFAHIPPSNCIYGVGESEEHRKAKAEIYKALKQHPQVTKLQLERYLGDVRPDISFCFQDKYIAIEVQISTLSLDTIDRRTKAYAQKGIHLLWVSPYEPILMEGEKYNPRLWEKYVHTMYFGKVYYWLSGEVLLPVHFNEYQIYVESSSWWEGEGEYACEVEVGGYYRYSKRYRTPCFLEHVKITELSPMVRSSWSSKKITVPAARLWCMRKEASSL